MNIKDKIKHQIVNYVQAPQFMKDNIYIKSGYRINFKSFPGAIKSLFMVHNEIVNIWSHFLGAILIIVLGILLCTSFGNIDFVSWKQKLTDNVNERLQPIYNELKVFDPTISMISSGVETIKYDYHLIETNVVENFNSLIQELSLLKNEVITNNIQTI